jgi:hypothetical protein
MSLHKFAEQVASQGRGEDSLLVHMTPDEVQRLQSFAQANGRSLTINPDTGLPEAGMLSDLFKMVAPIALGAFLGPGAFGIAGMGLSAGTAGLITGGITSLATGSLSRGLMAGLGAYGGAGLAQGFMDAGTTALGGVGAEAALQAPSVDAFVGNAEGMTSGDAFNNFLKSDANPAVAGKADVFGAGAKAAMADPMAFAKNNLGNLAYAAAPIAAGLMVPTTTKLPEPRDSGLIRQMAFNINPDTGRPDPLYGMREMTPVKTSEFGNKTFKGQRDLFYQQNPNPYELGVGSLNQPPQQQQQPNPMATGGIVALARGGVAHFEGGGNTADVGSSSGGAGINADVQAAINSAYAAGDYSTVNDIVANNNITAADVAATYQGFDTSGLAALGINLPGASAPVITGGSNDYTVYSDTSVAPVVGGGGINTLTGGGGGGGEDTVAKAYWAEQAALRDAAANKANTDMWNKQNTDMWNKQNTDMWNKQNTDKWAKDALTPVKYTDAQLAAFFLDPKNKDVDIQKAIKDFNADPAGVNRYIASLTSPFVGSTDTKGGSGTLAIYNSLVARGIDPTEYYNAAIKNDPKYAGWSKEDIARGYNLDKGAYALTAQIAKDKIAADPKLGYDREWVKFMDAGKYSVNDMAQAFGISKNEIQARYDAVKAAEKALPPPTTVTPTGFYGNNTGNPLTSTPGDITTNKDGTVTVTPNIPGRPDGGFPGMGAVRDAYTAGGGSLGYTAPVPKTAAEHNAMYNKLTDDSLDAYNFLMGKGKNLSQRTASADRPVMRRYDEAVLGRKIPRLVAKKTDTKTTDTKETVAGNTAVVGGVNFDLTDPTQAPAEDNNGPWSWDITSKRWVQYGKFADGGMTGYAVGGGLGSLGSYSDGGRLLKGPGDGVSDSIPATIGAKNQPARLADGEFVIPARIVSELGNGSTDAGAKKLYAMMDRVQRARGKTTGKNKVAANSRSDKYLPA